MQNYEFKSFHLLGIVIYNEMNGNVVETLQPSLNCKRAQISLYYNILFSSIS